MTEDEATTKWCPFANVVRILATGSHPANRPLNADGNCIGSQCMAFVKRVVVAGKNSTTPQPGEVHHTIEDCHCGLVQVRK